ncbi:dermonecrotic toxin domain-containing protein [Pseudomonas fluorescens]|uniref:dermonecrotic toxin domain-containing protein n=1 Tax=Pseudomonas fluorescens TaxID=294 RepID=UPI003C19DEA1
MQNQSAVPPDESQGQPTRPATSDAPSQAVARRFASRPTLRQVAGQLLHDSILEHYPPLALDLDVTRLAIPNRTGGWDLKLLIDVALDYLGNNTSLNLTAEIDGRVHFLTNRTPSRLTYEAQGPKRPDMGVIQEKIQSLALTLGTRFQDALTAYWNQAHDTRVSHWQWLGDLLANGLNSAASLLPAAQKDDRTALYELARYPDRRERQAIPHPDGFVHAYCLETCLIRNDESTSFTSPDLLVVQGSRTFLYRVSGRLESYPNVEAFNQAWGREVERQFIADKVVIKCSEPNGNIFDTQAALLLERQLENLDAIQLPADQGVRALEERFEASTDPAPYFSHAPAPDQQPVEKIRATLPQWLKDASDSERAEYRQWLVEQAQWQRLTGGKSFLDGIENLHDFTNNALRDQMRLDHPDSDCEPGDLLLNFRVAAGDLGSGFITRVPMTLTELAIQNLSATPSGSMTITDKTGKAVPSWLTADYILGEKGLFSSTEGLVSRVNIGERYPHTLKTLLLDDNSESQRREIRFGQALKVQLPLQALEHTIRGEHGLSFQGYRFIKAVLHTQAPERVVDGQDIVIRALAFTRKAGAAADVVDNMFIIEPRDTGIGPHILYRPVYQDGLQQFSSREALFNAIAQAGPLQDSVLSWLPDRARPIYSNDGFNSPHILRFGLGDDTVRWEKPEPAQLAQDSSTEEIPGSLAQALATGNLTQHLYASNARALIDLADRESVSNAESRWAIVREGGWLLFNALLLPVLRGPAMLAGWMLQLAVALKSDVTALHSNDPTARELAWVDLLLNVGLILLHVSSRPHPPELSTPAPQQPPRLARLRRPPQDVAPPTAVIEQGVVGLPAEPPAGDKTQIDFIHSTARDSSSQRLLNALLELKVAWPVPAPAPVEIGMFKGLYRIDHQWHASLGGLLFEVSIVPGFGDVYIIHPEKPLHPGFKLKTDGQGRWSLDTGLKLQGGGPKNRLKAKLAEIDKKREQATVEVNRIGGTVSTLATQAKDMDQQLEAAKVAYESAHNELGAARVRLRASPEDQALQGDHRLKVIARSRSRLDFQVLQESDQVIVDQLIQARRDLIQAYRQLKDVDVRFDYEQKAIDEYTAILTVHELRIRQLASLYLASFISEQGESLIELQYNISDIEGAQRMYDLLETNFAASERHAQAIITLDGVLTELAQNFKTGPAQRLKYLKGHPDRRFSNRVAALLESLDVLNTLSIDTTVEAKTPQEQYFLNVHEDRLGAMSALEDSHLDLLSTDGFTAQERKDVLINLIKHYKRRLQINTSLLELESPLIRPRYMSLLMERLEITRDSAESELADLLREDEFLPVSPVAFKPIKAPSKTKRVFKSRDNGDLVGELEPATTGMPFPTIVTRNPVTLQVSGRFMEHPNEGWVEIVDAAPVRPTPTPQPRSFAALRTEGQRLIDEIPAIERSIEFQKRKLSDPQRRDELNPRDWSDMLEHQAKRIETLASELEHAHPDNPQINNVLESLRSTATATQLKGQQHCIEGYKAQRPRQESIEYLRDRQAVDIGLVQALKRTAAKDYLTEFAIREKNSVKVLWYAHFHYAQANSAPSTYTIAHLKRPEHRFVTLKDLIAQAGPDNKLIIRDLYSPITPPRDQRLFLDLVPDQ